ncbi:flagellin [Exiguobacterium chiriqhucha]|uniref:flagellin N-terminal helical domain-containing protein n=1 Tax=Exiguobacterium chiriqhucha TaxID=1385984 RepID=UPI0007364D2A|nr:flagellin [Exiguobacterium chiriqhucha]
MIINNNMNAMNAHRNMSANTTQTGKAMEKLSSGLRINRAGDDAAGLAISEKMRGQIRGLDQATRNSQDGISMIQTAEGALNETHSILQRMRELSVQSATDTNTTSDRTKIQSEVDELAKEITRISNTTEFNTKNLLAGGLDSTLHIGANASQNLKVSVSAMDAKSLGVAGDLVSSTLTTGAGITGLSNVNADLGAGANVTVVATAATETLGADTISGVVSESGTYTGTQDTTYQFRVGAVSGNTVDAVEVSKDGGTTWTAASKSGTDFNLGEGVVISITDVAGNAVGQSGSIALTAAKATVQLANGAGNIGSAVTVRGNQSSATIGDATTGRTAEVTFNFATMANGSAAIAQTKQASVSAVTDASGNVTTNATTQKGLNVSTQSAANVAVTAISKALETVSSERSKLGAVQNRLEHTINNLSVGAENLQAAESRIRDVDMAKEMMNFSKNNILNQAAQAMLAQSKSQPEAVLQLLR